MVRLHRLLQKDLDLKTGCCEVCGDVPIYVHRNGRTGSVTARCSQRLRDHHIENMGNRDFQVKRMLNAARQRCRKRGTPFAIDANDILAVWNDCCPICSVSMTLSLRENGNCLDKSYSLDQIRPGKGYLPDNIAVICYRCNAIKGQGTSSDHERIAEWMRSHGE